MGYIKTAFLYLRSFFAFLSWKLKGSPEDQPGEGE